MGEGGSVARGSQWPEGRGVSGRSGEGLGEVSGRRAPGSCGRGKTPQTEPKIPKTEPRIHPKPDLKIEPKPKPKTQPKLTPNGSQINPKLSSKPSPNLSLN